MALGPPQPQLEGGAALVRPAQTDQDATQHRLIPRWRIGGTPSSPSVDVSKSRSGADRAASIAGGPREWTLQTGPRALVEQAKVGTGAIGQAFPHGAGALRQCRRHGGALRFPSPPRRRGGALGEGALRDRTRLGAHEMGSLRGETRGTEKGLAIGSAGDGDPAGET